MLRNDRSGHHSRQKKIKGFLRPYFQEAPPSRRGLGEFFYYITPSPLSKFAKFSSNCTILQLKLPKIYLTCGDPKKTSPKKFPKKIEILVDLAFQSNLQGRSASPPRRHHPAWLLAGLWPVQDRAPNACQVLARILCQVLINFRDRVEANFCSQIARQTISNARNC